MGGNKPFVVVAYCTPRMFGTIEQAMISQGFVGIEPFYWYKSDANNSGNPMRPISSVQMMIYGYSSQTFADATHRLPKDPDRRHNLRFASKVSNLHRDAQGEVVNVTEKPPEIAQLFGDWFAKGTATNTALVLGAGAGGDAMGFLSAGVHTIMVENDPKQMAALRLRIESTINLQATEILNGEQPENTMELVTLTDLERVSEPWMLPFSPRDAATFVLSDFKSVSELRVEKKKKSLKAHEADAKCVACGLVELLAKCVGCANMVCACRGENALARSCCDECNPAARPGSVEQNEDDELLE